MKIIWQKKTKEKEKKMLKSIFTERINLSQVRIGIKDLKHREKKRKIHCFSVAFK